MATNRLCTVFVRPWKTATRSWNQALAGSGPLVATMVAAPLQQPTAALHGVCNTYHDTSTASVHPCCMAHLSHMCIHHLATCVQPVVNESVTSYAAASTANCAAGASPWKLSGLYTTVMYSEQDGQRAISSPAASSCVMNGVFTMCVAHAVRPAAPTVPASLS